MSKGSSEKGLSSELTEFISSHFFSIRQLEVLLWLRAHSDKAWNAEQIARALCCNTASAARWLEGFKAERFLVMQESDHYRYEPARKDTDDLVKKLAVEYKVRHLRVIDIIINRPTKKMMDLMEAFAFRRGNNNDDK